MTTTSAYAPGAKATAIPVFSCTALERALDHYGAVGFGVGETQFEPYPYAVLKWGAVELHLGGGGKIDQRSHCLIMVEDVADLYAAVAGRLRKAHRGLPVSGFPRITRFRQSQTRFTVYDADGNSLQFIAVDEPEYDYASNESGGDATFGRTLTGISRSRSSLLRALETATFLRDTYHDDRAAAKKLDNTLARATDAAPIERARATAARAELALALGEGDLARRLRDELLRLPLDEPARTRHREELEAAERLAHWLSPPP